MERSEEIDDGVSVPPELKGEKLATPTLKQNQLNVALAVVVLFWKLSAAFAADCVSDVAAIDEKFKFKTHWGTYRIVDADPDKLCQANSKAALDKRIGANSVDESSICRSTYVRLKDSIQDYKVKYLTACEKGNQVASVCSAESRADDPKAAFRCVSANANGAAAAERAAAAAMQKAALLADDLKKSADKVRTSYVHDYEQIAAAFKANDEDLFAAEVAGNLAQVSALQALRDEANGVRNGRFVRGATVLDTTVLTPLNGGQSTITAYRSQLERAPDLNSPYGLIVTEQDWARDTALSFRQTAEAEIRERNLSAARLAQFAAQNERLLGPPVAESGNQTVSKGTNSSGGMGSTLTGLAGMAAAAGPLASMLQQKAAAENAATTVPEQTTYTQPVNPNANAGGQTKAPGTSVLGGEQTTPDKGGRSLDPTKPAEVGARGPLRVDGNRGEVSGSGHRPADHLLGSSGKEDPASISSQKDGSPVKASAPGPDSPGGDRKTASSDSPGDAKQACEGKDCGALASVQGNQFTGGGALGVPQIGAADPMLSPLGALEGLFGALPGEAGAKKGIGEIPPGGLAGQFFENETPGAGEHAAAPEGVAAANSLSLFTRVHSTHEKALQRGIVSLFHVKL